MRTLAPPPAWPISVPRAKEERERRLLAEVNAQYPDAVPWYGPKSGLWFAAPPGAPGLLYDTTLGGLAHKLAEHQRAMAAPRSRQAIAAPKHPVSSASSARSAPPAAPMPPAVLVSSAAPHVPRSIQREQRRLAGRGGAVQTPRGSAVTAPTTPATRDRRETRTPGRLHRVLRRLGIAA